MNPVGLVILAAGASTRLGQPKQLLPYGEGTLLRHIATVAVDSGCAPVIVVLGASAELLRAELNDLPVHPVINPDWEEGMASSLRTGIAALEPSQASAALILLCDQPLVTAELLQDMVRTATDTKCAAVVCKYDEKEAVGPPCLFDRSLFPDLLALRGAQGAKQLLARLPGDSIALVPFPGGRYDIDTKDDWNRLRGETNSQVNS